MNHEVEFIETIEEATEKLNHAAYYIKNKHDDIKKERDEMLMFLRSLQKMDVLTTTDAINEYLTDYDIPF